MNDERERAFRGGRQGPGGFSRTGVSMPLDEPAKSAPAPLSAPASRPARSGDAWREEGKERGKEKGERAKRRGGAKG